MTLYIYPQNLKAKAHLWFWGLRDFLIICIMALLSVVIIVHSGILLPGAITMAYAFLTIRTDETTVMDYLRYAVCFFITTQQCYQWR